MSDKDKNEGGGGQPKGGERSIDFTALPPALDEACSLTSLAFLKKQPEYGESKRVGDLEKAFSMVHRLLETRNGEKFFNSLIGKLDPERPVCIIPVLKKEPSGMFNAIPCALAIALEDRYLESRPGRNIHINLEILRTGGRLTGKGHSERLAAKTGYHGRITDKSAQHVLVDDNITMGGSIRELMEHVKSQGGETAAVCVLSTRYTKKLRLDEKLVERFLESYDISKIEFEEIMGYGIEKATPGELSALSINPNRFRGADGLRNIRASETGEGDVRERQGNIQTPQIKRLEEGESMKLSLSLTVMLLAAILALSSGCLDARKTRWGMSMKEVSEAGLEQKLDKIDDSTLQGRSSKGHVRSLSWYKFDAAGLVRVTYMLNPGRCEDPNDYIAFYDEAVKPIRRKFGEPLNPQKEFYVVEVKQNVKESVTHKGVLIMEGVMELRQDFSDKDTIVHTKAFADKVVGPDGSATDKREFRVEIVYEKKMDLK